MLMSYTNPTIRERGSERMTSAAQCRTVPQVLARGVAGSVRGASPPRVVDKTERNWRRLIFAFSGHRTRRIADRSG